MESTSDTRTANNAVRHQYKLLSDIEKQDILELKDLGAAFIKKCRMLDNSAKPSRELALAETNAEQAVMWAVKHVTA